MSKWVCMCVQDRWRNTRDLGGLAGFYVVSLVAVALQWFTNKVNVAAKTFTSLTLNFCYFLRADIYSLCSSANFLKLFALLFLILCFISWRVFVFLFLFLSQSPLCPQHSFISCSLKCTLVANVKSPAGIKQVPSVAMSTFQESAVEQFDLLNIIRH